MTTNTAAGEGAGVSEFDELLKELDGTSLSKSMEASGSDDQTVADAAAEGDADNDDEGADNGEDDGDADGEAEPMGKSFAVTLADGSTEEVFDASALVKALVADNAALKDTVGKQGAVIKTLVTKVTALTKESGALLKSMRADVDKVRAGGVQRRSTLTVMGRPDTTSPRAAAAAAAKPKFDGGEFMAKALEAQGAGRLTAANVAALEMMVDSGREPSDDIKKLVLGA